MLKPRLWERDKNLGRDSTNDAVGNNTANTTGNSVGATMRRLGTPTTAEQSRREPQRDLQEKHRRK